MGQVLAPSLDIQGSHWLPSLTSPVGPTLQPLTVLSPKQLCVPQCALWPYGALCPPHLLLGPWGERTPLHRSGPGRGIASREAPPSTPCPTVPAAEPTTTLEVFYTYCTQQGRDASRPSLDHQGPAPHQQGQTSARGTGGPTMAFLNNHQTTHQPQHWPPHAEGSGGSSPSQALGLSPSSSQVRRITQIRPFLEASVSPGLQRRDHESRKPLNL